MFTVVTVLAFISTTSANDNKNTEVLKKDCGAMASAMLEIQEEYFGCMDSNTYNFFYNNLYNMCEGNMPISGLIH